MKKKLLLLISMVLLAAPVYADVEPGDVINSQNVDKIKGLVPEYIMDWVSQGKMVMNIGQLNFDPNEFKTQSVKDSGKTNAGKYDINGKRQLIDKASGDKFPTITGIPFPNVKVDDENAGMKAMYNSRYAINSNGYRQYRGYGHVFWVKGKEDGRHVGTHYINAMPVKGKTEVRSVGIYDSPYKMAGMGVLQNFSSDPEAKGFQMYLYRPDTRKTRRMSTNFDGSRDFMGTKYVVQNDDMWAGATVLNIPQTAYEMKEVKTALMPFYSSDPLLAVKQDDGYHIDFNAVGHRLLFGQDVPEAKVADWAPTSLVWVKTKVFVIDWEPQRDGYAYGKSQTWLDANTMLPVFKTVNTSEGKFYKGVNYYTGVAQDANKSQESGMIDTLAIQAYDPKINQASSMVYSGLKDSELVYHIPENKCNNAVFTKGGFLRFCR